MVYKHLNHLSTFALEKFNSSTEIKKIDVDAFQNETTVRIRIFEDLTYLLKSLSQFQVIEKVPQKIVTHIIIRQK